jgi:hypothetical protein
MMRISVGTPVDYSDSLGKMRIAENEWIGKSISKIEVNDFPRDWNTILDISGRIN